MSSRATCRKISQCGTDEPWTLQWEGIHCVRWETCREGVWSDDIRVTTGSWLLDSDSDYVECDRSSLFSRASNKTWKIPMNLSMFRVTVQSASTSLGLACAFPRQNDHTMIRSTTRYLLISAGRFSSFFFPPSVPTQCRVIVSETTLPCPQSECCFDILSSRHEFMKRKQSRCAVAVSGRIVCLYRQMIRVL